MLDRPDGLHFVSIIFLHLLLEDREQVPDKLLIQVRVANQQQGRDELSGDTVTLEAYFRMLVLISFSIRLRRWEKMKSVYCY